MTTEKSKIWLFSSFALLLLFIVAGCGGGGGETGPRTDITLELKAWEDWSGDNTYLSSAYDAETQTATLSHNDTSSRIAFSQHALSLAGKYRLQFSEAQGIQRAQLITSGADQLRTDMIEPAQSWVDVHAAWPIDVNFAQGTEFIHIRVIFAAGEAKVGTFSLIPLDSNGTPLSELDPETDNARPDTESPNF
jgi:hypothetical protein